LVASLIHADWLFLLTDVDGLYSSNPKTDPNARPIYHIDRMDQLKSDDINVGEMGSRWGTGGMATKISAAATATAAGVRTVITDGRSPQNIPAIIAGEQIGTQFEPHPDPINARKHWIAHTLVPAGELTLDEGAVNAIQKLGRSLLAAGILEVQGDFESQQAVKLMDPTGQEFARGLVNYNSPDLRKIKGVKSENIAQILGYGDAETVIHRDNLVILS
jgi:glutamate 5-kinase